MSKSLWTRILVLLDVQIRQKRIVVIIGLLSIFLAFTTATFLYSPVIKVIPVIVVGGLPYEDFHGEWRPTSVVPHYAHSTIWAAELWRQMDLDPLIIFVNCTLECKTAADYLKKHNFNLKEISDVKHKRGTGQYTFS